MQLLRDSRVRFAGYAKRHPLENSVEIRVQSNGESTPKQLVEDSCYLLQLHLEKIREKFEEALVDSNMERMQVYSQDNKVDTYQGGSGNFFD